MSRTWSSCAVDDTLCGSCHNVIRFGAPIQTITPHPDRRSTAKFVRCRLCADGEPPDDLKPAVVNAGAPILPTPLLRTGPGTLPLDFKSSAAGREPGSDG